MSSIEEIRLRLQKIRFFAELSPDVPVDAAVEIVERFIRHSIQVGISVRLPMIDIGEATWPDGWSEALWDRFAPRWAKRIRPTRMRSLAVHQIAMPTMGYSVSRDGGSMSPIKIGDGRIE